MLIYLIGGLLAAGVLGLLIASLFRVVCNPAETHIVLAGKQSRTYGSGQDLGSVYYSFPSWLPVIGVVVRVLPVSNFTIELNGYEAYDIGKVPFAVDVISFFRVEDAEIAAKRIESKEELNEQLQDILRGAIRSILAGSDIEDIMAERTAFGEKFSTEVDPQLEEWGVKAVKNIELMDIRDTDGDSKVIFNIMAKKRSLIDKDSRVEVAKNEKEASIAEIEAKKEEDVKNQAAMALVGQRTADKDRDIGVANEKSLQLIAEQKSVTAEKDMAVEKVTEVRRAEIAREVQIVASEEKKAQMEIEAKGMQLETEAIATGDKNAEIFRSEGILAVGSKEAEVIKAKEMANVAGEIELAEKIAEMPEYMMYLRSIKAIGAGESVGVAQSEALKEADLKLFSTGGGDGEIGGLLDMLSAKGGVNLAGAMEMFQDAGGVEGIKALLQKGKVVEVTPKSE